jgi:hypothetical protein
VTAGLLLIRRLRPIGEPAALAPIEESGAWSVEGTTGAGRIVHALAGAGIRCDPIEQLVLPADVDIDGLGSTLGERTFETVVLGSHLVNLPDADRRAALLDLAAHGVAPGGSLIVEHHPIDWAETAADVEPTPGSAVGMVEVRRDPPFVSAVSVFDIGGRIERQPFRARVLSEAELAAALASAGLNVARRLSPTLIEARAGA